MSKEKSGNGFITFLLIIIVLIMLIFGSMLTGIVKVNGPIITLGNPQTSTETNITNTNTINEETISSTSTNNTVASPDTNTITQNQAVPSDANENAANSNTTFTPQKTSVASAQILSYYEKYLADYKNHMYSVIDVNGDSIPELFIFTTGSIKNQIIAYTSVYTYDENLGDKSNNYIVYIGNINGRIDNNTSLYKMNDGRLLSVYGHMGYESTTYYRIINDWLVRNEFSNREVDKDNDYISGDIEITFKKTTDNSLIKNYKE